MAAYILHFSLLFCWQTENHFLYEEVNLDLGTVNNDDGCSSSTDVASVSIEIQYDIVRVIHDGTDDHNGTEAM